MQFMGKNRAAEIAAVAQEQTDYPFTAIRARLTLQNIDKTLLLE